MRSLVRARIPYGISGCSTDDRGEVCRIQQLFIHSVPLSRILIRTFYWHYLVLRLSNKEKVWEYFEITRRLNKSWLLVFNLSQDSSVWKHLIESRMCWATFNVHHNVFLRDLQSCRGSRYEHNSFEFLAGCDVGGVCAPIYQLFCILSVSRAIKVPFPLHPPIISTPGTGPSSISTPHLRSKDLIELVILIDVTQLEYGDSWCSAEIGLSSEREEENWDCGAGPAGPASPASRLPRV